MSRMMKILEEEVITMETKANAKGKDTKDLLLSRVKGDRNSLSSGEDGASMKRDSWPHQIEFILSVVGFCVGFGNLWRFPYVCMKNGGGAFLIPFILSLFICGMPLFFLDVSLGQFLGKSAVHIWRFCPLLKGIGISTVILCIISSFYYTMLLGWTLIYLVNSFKSPLPWTRCDQSWNTPNCATPKGFLEQNGNKSASFLGNMSSTETPTMLLNSTTNLTTIAPINVTSSTTSNLTVSSTQEFWFNNVLESSSGLDDIGGLPWHTALSLVVANTLVLIGIVKGIQTSGKVVYITATLPYLLLIVFFILGLTLEGAADGVLFYIKPDFEKLMTMDPWMEAAIQVFYSLGPGWGGLITMASYNKFNNNCMRDAILLTLACEGTSIFGGFVVFMILGHMAHRIGVEVSQFATSGSGLAFIVYPEAISYLPVPQLWGVLFFLMFLSLGLDSMFMTVEVFLTAIVDYKPYFVNKWRVGISVVTMIFLTLVGLLYATRGGIYWVTLTDWYVAAFALILQSVIQCLTVSWIYGSDRFCRDIELMIGRKPYVVFVWAWKYVTPTVMLILWVLTMKYYKPPSYGSYKFPPFAEVIGWFIAVAPFTVVIFCAVKEIYSHSGSFMQRLKRASTPGPDWLPSSLEAREKYQAIQLELTSVDGTKV